MTHSISRRTTLAIVVAVAGLGASVGAATEAGTAAAAKRPACSELRERQRVRVTFAWRYHVELSRVDNGVLTVHKLADQTRSFATLNIVGATCKRPGGRWRMIDPISFGYSSVGIDQRGNLVSSGLMKGWGVGIRGATTGAIPKIVLQIMHCGQGNFFRTLKAITGVPIPRVGFWPSLALWGAGQVLPADKVRCGDVGLRLLAIFADKRGALRVTDLTPNPAGETESTPGSTTNPWSTTKSYDVKPIAVSGP
jgi:hypothetical protein